MKNFNYQLNIKLIEKMNYFYPDYKFLNQIVQLFKHFRLKLAYHIAPRLQQDVFSTMNDLECPDFLSFLQC